MSLFHAGLKTRGYQAPVFFTCGANLTGAKIEDEQLALAKTNWMTIRPNGKRG